MRSMRDWVVENIIPILFFGMLITLGIIYYDTWGDDILSEIFQSPQLGR